MSYGLYRITNTSSTANSDSNQNLNKTKRKAEIFAMCAKSDEIWFTNTGKNIQAITTYVVKHLQSLAQVCWSNCWKNILYATRAYYRAGVPRINTCTNMLTCIKRHAHTDTRASVHLKPQHRKVRSILVEKDQLIELIKRKRTQKRENNGLNTISN